jgi:mRNA-degrading endonuclease RelE of RelBE toxin-antitoxin system
MDNEIVIRDALFDKLKVLKEEYWKLDREFIAELVSNPNHAKELAKKCEENSEEQQRIRQQIIELEKQKSE